MTQLPQTVNRPRWHLAANVVGVIALFVLGLLLSRVPPSEGRLHNILHDLAFVPLLLGGALFGFSAAATALLLAAITQAPHFSVAFVRAPVHAYNEVIDLTIFGIAALVAGVLSDRARQHRQGLEKTKQELEDVYRALQQNVDQLKRAERLSVAGQLAAGLAHEIRNPLASISGAAGILRRKNASTENLEDCLGIIDIESHRLNKLLTSFLEFARTRPPRFQPTDVGEVIASATMLTEHAMNASRIQFERNLDRSLPELECDPEQLKQVLLNLLINAAQVTPDNGVVTISAVPLEDRVAITVHDQGPGIPPNVRDRIFDPFFTTKEAGTGLGLAIASQIVQQHNGVLRVDPPVGEGATLRLELPVRQKQAL